MDVNDIGLLRKSGALLGDFVRFGLGIVYGNAHALLYRDVCWEGWLYCWFDTMHIYVDRSRQVFLPPVNCFECLATGPASSGGTHSYAGL